MPRSVPDDYFRQGVFRGAAPGELFSRMTCVACGHREKTWAGFQAHRRTCVGDQRALGRAPPPAHRGAAPLTEADMGLLADLLRQADADGAA